MPFLSGILRHLNTFTAVSGNRIPLSRRLKITSVKFTYPKGYMAGVPLSPLIFSWVGYDCFLLLSWPAQRTLAIIETKNEESTNEKTATADSPSLR